jgi:protein gp37
MLSQPLRWKKPRHIFVCSMTDLFADFVPDEWIDRIFAVMALAQDHTFQVLTKRAARMREYMEGRDWADAANAIHDQHIKRLEREMYVMGEIVPPLPNVQLGVSAEDQKRVDERVPDLLATPAAVRFVSAEPLLGPTKFRQDWVDYLKGWYTEMESGHDCDGTEESCMRKCPVPVPVQAQSHSLDWVIVGGESGPRRRPMELKWARSIRDQCREVGVSFFMKQVDKVIPVPNDLAIREMPTTREMLPAGDRSAGEW